MKIINNVIWLILVLPAVGKTQVLGAFQGNSVEISSVAGATQNSFMNKQWLYRTQNGNDWYNARLHDGISVDISFLTPHVDTRSWWERDPYNNIQSWGDGANTYLTINQGNVGIGVDAPAEKLEVNGRIKAGDRIYANSTDVNALSLVQSYNSAGGPSVLRSYSGTSFWDFAASQSAGGNSLFIGQGMDVSVNNAAITIVSNNNVGIGTTDPKGYKLAVNGKIRAHEIKVETANWPDYVFSKDYQLPTLQQTEQHIKEKGHLPGIPSAAEVKANGLDLGEMNAKLLQKIEELTLHLIEKDKQLNDQHIQLNDERKINQNQEERLKKLEIKLSGGQNK